MANEAENPEVSDDATDTPTAATSPATKKRAAKKKAAAKKPAARKAAAKKAPAKKAAAKKVSTRKVGVKKIDVKGLADALAEPSAEADEAKPAAGIGVVKSSAPAKSVAAKAGSGAGKDAKKKSAKEDFTGPAAASSLMGVVRKRDVTSFLRQLIMLLKAGTPILRALQTLSKRGSNARARALVSDITQYVEAGNPLWQAFDRHSRYFDRVFVNLIKASEASGTLITVLERVVAYRTERELMVKRVRSAMFYPVTLIVAVTLVVLLITKYVIPQFQDMFSKQDVQLEPITKFLFAASDLFANIWYWPYVIALVLVLLYNFVVSKNPVARLWVDSFKLRIPIVGPIVKGGSIVELTRTLALLIRSGVPMMATLDLTRSSVNNRRIAGALQGVRDSIERGGGMEAPLRKAAPAIPHVVTDMLVTGEESGKVDEVADQIADIYEKEVEIQTRGLGEALQPFFTVVVGVGVLILFVALFLPMLSLMDSLNSAGS
jgi:type IV pilus assembly protein PilC